MKRLLATVRCDAQLQLRNGFYYATAFVVLIWSLVLLRLPDLDFGWLLPALLAGNLLLNTFYFMGGLVLLEKDEGTLEARTVTPLRTGEYLAAKAITLTLLALVENVIIVALFRGLRFELLPLVAGIVLASGIYVLTGFVAVVRYGSINEFLMPSVVYTSLLTLPLLTYLGQWEHWLLYLHPLQAPLLLLRAAFVPVEGWQVVYSVTYGGACVALAYLWSRQAFAHFVVAGGSSS
ncbi:MAG: ABC transporter permease [Gemmatimonadetes bacterium]|nr:ABC transporter permease [Gemmatimonadota bacterium]